ncbi:MAG: hypothetical protein AAGF11_16265 [Myxococcota bacterium]
MGDRSWACRIRAELEARLFGESREALTIGRDSLEHHLGEGGMGKVYAAFDPGSGQRVVIKTLQVSP